MVDLVRNTSKNFDLQISSGKKNDVVEVKRILERVELVGNCGAYMGTHLYAL